MGVWHCIRTSGRLCVLYATISLDSSRLAAENVIDTGNTQYNQEIIEATTWQAGMNGQFNPSNQSFDMGNDDQAYWTFTALNAAETNFPSPPQGYPEWAAMADIVFTLQAGRWDATTCGGGLHWQVFQINAGYNYMNVAANGAFFQLASRLARYTGNETYVHWAEKMWNWLEQSPLIDSSNGDAWKVYDGTQTAGGCTGAEKTQWTYNYGVLIGGLAYIYNHVSTQALCLNLAISNDCPYADRRCEVAHSFVRHPQRDDRYFLQQ